MTRQFVLTIMVWAALWLPALASYRVFSGNLIQPDAADSGENTDSLIDTSTAVKEHLLSKSLQQNSRQETDPLISPKYQNNDASAPKNRQPWPTGALLLSVAIPGGGQFYNRKYIKSFLYGGTEIYLIKYVYWRWQQMDEHWRNFKSTDDDLIKAQQFALYEKKRDSRNTHIWLTALVVFVSMFDAYVDAHLADFDQTDKAFEAYIIPENDKIQLNLVYNF